MLRDHYGPANDVDAVFFTDRDEAIIFAKDRNGVSGICVNLTVVSMMQQMEGVADADVLKSICGRRERELFLAMAAERANPPLERTAVAV